MAQRIKETKSQTWDDKPPKHATRPKPTPVDPECTPCFPLVIAAGQRGQGKTFNIVKMVQHYQETGFHHETIPGVLQDIRVIIFCPSAAANPVYTALKVDPDDVITEYTDEKLVEKEHDIYQEEENSLRYHRGCEVYQKWLNRGQNEHKMSQDELIILHEDGYRHPAKPRFPNGPAITMMILDDLVATPAMGNTGNNALNNLLLRNRHKRICAFIATQAVKQIQKMIRNNASNWLIFKFANARMVARDLQEQISAVLTEEEFIALYEYATGDEPHSFLNIDISDVTAPIFRRNWATYLQIGRGDNKAELAPA